MHTSTSLAWLTHIYVEMRQIQPQVRNPGEGTCHTHLIRRTGIGMVAIVTQPDSVAAQCTPRTWNIPSETI